MPGTSTTRGRRYPPDYLRRDEIAAILDTFHAYPAHVTRHRDRTLIVVLWRSGLRVSEALALQTHDIDMVGSAIRVRSGKGGKARTVGVDGGTVDVLERWLTARDRWVTTPWVFPTGTGNPLAAAHVRRMLPRVAKDAGVTRRVHAHIFRHTFTVELAREGVPAVHIQRLLGHTSLATTTTYLASLSPEDAIDIIRHREW